MINSLKKDLNQENYNGLFFELPYDETKLQELLGNYYFKGSMGDKPKDWEMYFLSHKDSDKCYMFCKKFLSNSVAERELKKTLL